MNPQNDPIAAFQNDIGQWELAINSYQSDDPLELWFRYICWLESHVNSTPALEAKFRKAVEQCLSTYDKFENYKQDLRMVKLWIKYIDFQPNPLNLYKILYQQGIGTTCAAFYKGWAHYYNSSNLFKQAESIFNLGIQLKAQPIEELETAQKNFRFSLAQRMLYNDESSKKRTISSLAEQRQQVTSLSPHQNQAQPAKRLKIDTQDVAVNESAQVDPQQAPVEDYQYASTSSDPGYVISSSLNYVYGDTNSYAPIEEQIVEPEEVQVIATFESGFQPPRNFVNYARNAAEPWHAPLCLEEPYDPNARFFYPKRQVYPGNGQEFSLEELKAQKWQARVEEKRKEEVRLKQEAESLRQRQEQERLRQEMEAKRLIEEQTRIRLEQEKLLQKQREEAAQRDAYQQQMTYQQNSVWNCHSQGTANYDPAYYQNSPYENSPQYSYSHDHRYQSHFASQQQHLYEHSPSNFQNSPNYQNSPTFHQQPTVIVNRNQYDSSHVQPQPPIAEPYYALPLHHQQQQPYSGNEYQTYQHPPQIPHPVQPHAVEQASPAVVPAQAGFEEHDYQDVEYLIDHQGEIDPDMLQQPIVESFENDEESSTADDSDEEPYSGPAPVVNSYMLDDLEEQIEASTIRFSSNGKSRDKKITIKFRKEKTTTTIINSESNSESSMPLAKAFPTKNKSLNKSSLEPSSTSSSSSGKKKSRKQKFQSEMLNTFDGDSTQFMPSATNSCSSTANGEFNGGFSSVSFNGCVTPARKNASKTSTPVSSYKFLRKPASILSNQNEDSICSFNGDQNSFFQAENDEDLKGRRMERALATTEEHLTRRDIDPFNSELCRAFLIKLNFPNRENTTDYRLTNSNLPKLTKNQVVPINGVGYQIEKEVGRGSYGAVFRGVNTSDGSVVALKYQKTPNSWELYVCSEVKKRLTNTDILPGFMSISAAVIAPNASVLISEFSQYGSLLDINNRIRQATTKVMHESLVMHFASQILNIVNHLHSINIIHADIKPDNFLLMTLPSADTYVPSLRLIDFGCAIDMNLFKEETEFRKIIQTDGFTCIEMQEGRPWSYQTDLFCVAGTIHVMLFGEYMQVNKKFGVWEIKQKIPRYLNKNVWGEVFPKLLNIKDNKHLPDLRRMRSLINSQINDNELVKHIRTCSNLIRKR